VTVGVVFLDNADASADIAVACADTVEVTIGVSSDEHKRHVCDAFEGQLFCADEFEVTVLLDC
jgi:hypothetical protein